MIGYGILTLDGNREQGFPSSRSFEHENPASFNVCIACIIDMRIWEQKPEQWQ